MKLKWICCFIAALMFIYSAGQDKKIKFNSINTGGIIIGQSNSYGMFQTVNGLRYPKWFAGIGAGYDYHYYKSIPLFIDARRYLGKEKNGFLYADIGYNYPQNNKPGKEIFAYSSYHFTGGVYSDIGVGYGFKFSKNTLLLISGGYSYKNINCRIRVTSPCLVPPCPESTSDYDYDFNRLIMKAGIQF